MEMTIQELHDRFISGYGPNNSCYKNASTEDKFLLDIVYATLAAGSHPSQVLTPEAIKQVKKLTAVDLSKIKCPDSKISSKSVPETFNPEDIPETAVCINYSCGDNVSKNYQYANQTNFGTCACDKINSMYCTSPFSQKHCPYFVADYSLFATHIIDENIVYKSYKERTSTEYIISVYDSNNNLLTKLNYPPSVINEIPDGSLEEEITDIVKNIHNSTFNAQDYSFVSQFLNSSESTVPSKPYISALIP